PELFDYKKFNNQWFDYFTSNSYLMKNEIVISEFKNSDGFKQKLLEKLTNDLNSELYEFYMKIK
ncbi:MAG: hypothetical protein ACK58Q_01095, partial [Chitinophagales bacterium]